LWDFLWKWKRSTKKLTTFAQKLGSLNNTFKPTWVQSSSIKVYSALVLPVLLYGIEIWTLIQKDKRIYTSIVIRFSEERRDTLFDHKRKEGISEELEVESTAAGLNILNSTFFVFIGCTHTFALFRRNLLPNITVCKTIRLKVSIAVRVLYLCNVQSVLKTYWIRADLSTLSGWRAPPLTLENEWIRLDWTRLWLHTRQRSRVESSPIRFAKSQGGDEYPTNNKKKEG
jgi:hypothetical protein